MQEQNTPKDEARSFWENMGIFDDLNKPNQDDEDPTEPSPDDAHKTITNDQKQTVTTPEAPNDVLTKALEENPSPAYIGKPNTAFDHIKHIISDERTHDLNKSNASTYQTFPALPALVKEQESQEMETVPEEVENINPRKVGNREHPISTQVNKASLVKPTPQVSHILPGKNAEFRFTTGKTPILVRIEGPTSLLNGFSESENEGKKPLITLGEPIAQQRSGLHPHRFSEGAEEKENLLKPHTTNIGKRTPVHQSSMRGAALPKAITDIPTRAAPPTKKDLNRITKWNEKPLVFSSVIMGAFIVFFGIIGIYRALQPDFEPINWQQIRLSLSGDEAALQVESATESARYVGGGGGRFPTRGQDWTPSDWARCGCPECTKNLNQWKAVQASLNAGKKTDLPDSSIIVTPGGKIDPLGSGSNDLYRAPQGANQTVSPGGAMMY